MTIYTSPVHAALEHIDWRGFLARPAFESPSLESLDTLLSAPILITGAGGSIGATLALRMARFDLPALVLLESAEKNLYELQQAWKAESGARAPAEFILGSAADGALLEELFAAHTPGVVFHAAAYKHVPLLEEQPFAAIANNIFATETVASAAASHGARVVLLSTDKAVEPASVMGATKRVAEEIVLASGGTVLRLGNILGSSGSVTEVFAGQIAQGGPLTVTDPGARRYFLTADEAVNLLLHASVQQPSSAVMAPVLPATHGIAALAGFMASELSPGREIPIRFTGLRPGEKLTERLWRETDFVCATSTGDLVSIESTRPEQAQLQSSLAGLRIALGERDLAAAMHQLHALVPDFDPSPDVLKFARNNRGSRVCA